MNVAKLMNWFTAPERMTKRKKPVRAQLRLEVLEDRAVPATLNVYFGGSIQAAIDRAHNGDRVLVHPGTYMEQITIAKSIEVEAAWDCDECDCGGSAVIEAPTNLGAPTVANLDAIVHVTGTGVHAEVEGFVIKGAATTDGVKNLLYGVRVDGNAFATIEANTITNIVDASNGRLGVAVSVGNASDSADGLGGQVGSACVTGNIISNYQRAGVVVSNIGSSVVISYNRITGIWTHPADSITGVEVSSGAVAGVTMNYITNNTNPNNAIQNGTGILLFVPGQGTEIEGNCVVGNDYGVFGDSVISKSTSEGQGVSVESNIITHNTFVGIEFDNSSGVDISYNIISHNGSDNYQDGGIFLFNSTGNLLVSNQSQNNSGSGIFVDATSTRNTIAGNTFTGNDHSGSIAAGDVAADVVDLTTGKGTGDTANTWTNDTGGTSATISGESVFKQAKPRRSDHG